MQKRHWVSDMKKKDISFILGLSILMGIIWVVGEIIMGLWLAVRPGAPHIIWCVAVVAVTLAISVWHSMIEDTSELEDPKRDKYERKVNKRK
ncbi:hypothetical protein [Ruminococcus sp.]|uniref:hypothetical protein n=2 Tax=Ruminococcus sp. TaxID=41978 RepID=UPI0025D6B8D8|nr:hypothetical protein [Ruminococcus sp.]